MLLDQPLGRDIAKGAGLINYEADWYSGSQIQIFMGDILIDNAAHISYSVSSEKIPYFGFGSEYYKFTAQAPLVIRGQLTIAFKETGYLLLPAQRFHNRKYDNLATTPRYVLRNGKATNAVTVNSLEEASRAAKPGRAVLQNVEQYVANQRANEKGTKSFRNGLYKQLSALEDADFENYAEELEDAIWFGSDTFNVSARDSLYSSRMSDSYGEIEKKDIYSHRRLDQYPPVDIWITFGDVEAPDGVNHTVQKLLDVEFTQETKTIVADETPVLETYGFIAKNRV